MGSKSLCLKSLGLKYTASPKVRTFQPKTFQVSGGRVHGWKFGFEKSGVEKLGSKGQGLKSSGLKSLGLKNLRMKCPATPRLIKVNKFQREFLVSSILPKKRMKKFDLTTMIPQVDLFSFGFWKKLKTPKRHLEINWLLWLWQTRYKAPQFWLHIVKLNAFVDLGYNFELLLYFRQLIMR